MLLTVAVLAALSLGVVVYKARVATRVNQGNLGWMSTQWLIEHRASNPS